jgi:1-acyl-sn-glycerol-3-phosphate acyltransferase
MQFLRSFIYAFGSYLSLIIIVSSCFVFVFMPLKFRYMWISKWNLFSIWWLKITVGLTYEVIGKENIPKKACVIASNHQSTWETIAFLNIFPQQVWVLKKELLWLPFFGWALAILAPIIIDRDEKLKSIKKVIKQGLVRLKQGLFVVVFPEGTRQPYQQLGKYQAGAIAIATKSNSQILPVYQNAGKYWAKGKFIKKKGCIQVIIGQPIEIIGKSKKEVVKELQDWTQEQQELELRKSMQ